MQHKDLDFDELVQKMHVLCPHLPKSQELSHHLRNKLEEQLKDKVPRVELEQLDLKYIIQNVKKSLSEFQRRIDESVAKQYSRRSTRVRKPIPHDPTVLNFFDPKTFRKSDLSSPLKLSKADKEQNCCKNKRCQQTASDLVGLVQVESLPVSASTNLVTILIPSILQEKLHSCKYKISIDLNRLDLTKRILDLNVSQIDSDLKENDFRALEEKVNESHECKITYEIKDDTDVQLVLDQTQSAGETSPHIEVKSSPIETAFPASLEPVVNILKEKDETPSSTKKRGSKRKDKKPLSNDPPKKRGRKPGSKNKAKPEKSELARYVEMFECNGCSPSSAVSQIVTSTTQNWDVLPDQTGQIAYFMNGEWTTLSALSSNGQHPVSTTNGTLNLEDTTENETFIPFDDFVNFIDNPAIDVGNNVIAQVLNGTPDAPDIALNLQEHNAASLDVELNQPSNSNENIQGMKVNTLKTKTAEHESMHPADRNPDMAVNLSIGSNTNILDLTKTNADERNSTALPKETVCTLESSNVIFSTCRSMPSLDDDGVDLFCSTPQREKCSESNVIAFSTQHFGHNNSFVQQDKNIIYSAIEIDRGELCQSTSDSSTIGNFSRNTQTPPKSNVKGEIIKRMSLLEIEQDFDDSLMDLGDCLDDDLLSLAPSSCFNSPLDDRFVDSNFLDMEVPKAKQCADSSASETVAAPRSHLEAGLPTLHEDELNNTLKNFKIPRLQQLKSSSDRSPEKNFTVKLSSKLKDKQSTSTSSFPSQFSPTRLNPLTNKVSSKDSNISAATPQIMSTLEMSKIFGSLCFTFLSDMCFESSCKFSHQFLDYRIISISVSLLQIEVLHSAYRFIWRHHKLFKLYFPIFCEEYGRRNMRRKFSTMVLDCELQPKCISYLRNIHSALSGCGFSKVNACRFILSKVKDRSDITIDILLEIIIGSDAKMFVSVIEQFSKMEGYKFAMNIINELATTCLRSGSAELVPVLIKCLINVDQTEFLTMRSPELIELLEMIKNGDGV